MPSTKAPTARRAVASKRMESTMASTPITPQTDLKSPVPHGVAGSIVRMLASRANGIWHDIRVLESLARRQGDATAQPRSLSAWFGGVAARLALGIANEVRIRRDMRKLTLMSDHMLKDIGLTRAEIDRAARYGRD
jgi:uncharacterized protein YjiS (DUF1127 family)